MSFVNQSVTLFAAVQSCKTRAGRGWFPDDMNLTPPSSPTSPTSTFASPRSRRLAHSLREPEPEAEPEPAADAPSSRPASSGSRLVQSLRGATQDALPTLRMIEGTEGAASAAATFQTCVGAALSPVSPARSHIKNRKGNLCYRCAAHAISVVAGAAAAAAARTSSTTPGRSRSRRPRSVGWNSS